MHCRVDRLIHDGFGNSTRGPQQPIPDQFDGYAGKHLSIGRPPGDCG
jgi:hypothetical protein